MVLLMLLALVVAMPSSLTSAQVALNGAGATFPAPLYTRWFSEYATKTGIQINYQAIGSGGGIRAITDKTGPGGDHAVSRDRAKGRDSGLCVGQAGTASARRAASSRTRGTSSRPYQGVSVRGSNPRIRMFVAPAST